MGALGKNQVQVGELSGLQLFMVVVVSLIVEVFSMCMSVSRNICYSNISSENMASLRDKGEEKGAKGYPTQGGGGGGGRLLQGEGEYG